MAHYSLRPYVANSGATVIYSIEIISEVTAACTQEFDGPFDFPLDLSMDLPTMDSPVNETLRTLSRRGHSYATGTKKTLENVINNLWDPEDNPDGFVSLGVAENV